VLPWIVMAAAGAGLVGVWCKSNVTRQSAAIFVVAAWTSAVVAATLTYPISAWRFGPPTLVVTALLWAACLVACRRHWSWHWPVVTALTAGVLIGSFVPLAERAPAADTAPWNDPAVWPEVSRDASFVESAVRLNNSASLNIAAAEAEIRFGRMAVSVHPLLHFESVSPARCWTIFAPRSSLAGSRPRLVGMRSDAVDWYYYQASLVGHLLHAESTAGGTGSLVEALRRLTQPVYSHLNSFCELTIIGHRRLTFSFSPCADVQIEAVPADYPVGRPPVLRT